MSLFTKAVRTLFRRGPRYFLAVVFARLAGMLEHQREGSSLVHLDHALDVDWTREAPFLRREQTRVDGPVRTAWLMSPPGRTSGGHQNIFRFMEVLEKAGHSCTIYIYWTGSESVDLQSIRDMLKHTAAYADLRAEIIMYDPSVGVTAETDAIFATGWETAYPAYLDPSGARRLYFVQDFEPSFYPLGSESILAENTYRFGFQAITAGRWLAHKLSTEYGMKADHYEFAVDTARYFHTNDERRNEVFFYARPVTPRRAFEFGLLALSDFAQQRPDVTITLAGWDVSGYAVPFSYRNLSDVDISQLNEVYNQSAAGLVMSLTNMSLLPLELMSSGVVPVMNDAENNRMVSNNPFIEYVPLSPAAMARKLIDVVDRPDSVAHSRAVSESVAGMDWTHSGVQFLAAFEGAMRG